MMEDKIVILCLAYCLLSSAMISFSLIVINSTLSSIDASIKHFLNTDEETSEDQENENR